MHLISFDASPRQLSKLRNGHPVRIKRGSGFNLVVSPGTYHLVSRAFAKNKGLQVKLTPEEIEMNETLSPEQHEALPVDENLFEHLPFAEGGSIFKKIKKALHSKTAKKIGRELKPLTRAMKAAAKDIAHEKIAQAHMAGAEHYGEDPRAAHLMNVAASLAHSKVAGTGIKSIGRKINKALHSKTAKRIGRELKPLTRAMKAVAKDIAHEKIAQAHMGAADYTEDPRMAHLLNVAADLSHSKVAGMGLGTGLGTGLAGLHYGAGLGTGMNAHTALRLANMAQAHADQQLAKMHAQTVHGQIAQPPIRRYWDEDFAPPSRGTGLSNHYNMIRGRGSLLAQDDVLPPALQSQPYGANWHMQFFLPPQYHRYNDGTDVEGRGMSAGGLYI